MKTTIRLCILAIACSAGLTFAQSGASERVGAWIKEKLGPNGEGKITKEEFMEHFKKEAEERFAKVDTNGDGVLDAAEVRAAMEKMREGAGGAGKEGGRGPPEEAERGEKSVNV